MSCKLKCTGIMTITHKNNANDSLCMHLDPNSCASKYASTCTYPFISKRLNKNTGGSSMAPDYLERPPI